MPEGGLRGSLGLVVDEGIGLDLKSKTSVTPLTLSGSSSVTWDGDVTKSYSHCEH